MPDMMADAAQWLSDALQDIASVEVTYRRGSDSVTFNATAGTSLLKVSDAAQGTVRVVRTDADFIFPAALLILSGDTVEPARFDIIDRVWPDGITRRYQILPLGGDEPEWRYADQHRIMIRVHTKYIGTV